ncbi:MAG: DNA helicase RecQ [Acidibrevibacterium sp.]|jgi:ATP-dependent DNA helicase RecQ|uniref:DNA helicase RecQ n=1 Tax=Acidibrevibacterium fodinaquatile TaxID=1969806 RepID=UPI0023A84569|nr:DNA helicase RecQ [Acidibrevibacterium fodinaquatile]MCA7119040.1 DNA helicase RecQ [Acidibrevibacterium fodinaquatile]
MSPDSPTTILRSIFGFPQFRGLQEEAVRHVIAGGDALVLMPTGGGKSLCYQVPALCRRGTAIVISPLIALMDDQVAALRQLGVSAAALHSECDPMAARETAAALARDGLDLLYVSPERLLGGLIERLEARRIALFAIDEAHCVSQWGHDFRPEYRALACLAARFPGVPRIALTATADQRTRADILASLAMPEARTFVASFHRPNLFLAARPKERPRAQLAALLARHQDASGIVYCGSRARTEQVAARLGADGVPAVVFHAGLARAEKEAALRRFRAGEAVVMVATIAFGMGIDRPDVRFVAHLDMPDSPEAYYQQIGRAGRDGEPAEALLLYGIEDIARARHFLARSQAPQSQIPALRVRLETMIGLAETGSCRTQTLLACFDERLEGPCGHCDNCLAPRPALDATVPAQQLLSAVYRTGQRFGLRHVVAVLRGEASEAVRRHGHDRLALFAIGRERSAEFWHSVGRAMIAAGALVMGEGYATLALDAGVARPYLRGERIVRIHAPTQAAPAGVALAPARSKGEGALFERLRAWRKQTADAQNLPPYLIFHDVTLHEIATLKPATLAALAQVRGVGAAKLQRYGKALLAALSPG